MQGDVAVDADFAFDVVVDFLVGAAEDGVGLDADAAEFADAVLGGFGFEFAGGGDEGQESEVDVADVVSADFVSHLADCL